MASYSQGHGHGHGIATGHMKEMLRRIWDLEQRAEEQTDVMYQREMEQAVRFENMEKQKDSEITSLQREIAEMKQRCRHLEGSLKERDDQIAYLLHRCDFFLENWRLENFLKNTTLFPLFLNTFFRCKLLDEAASYAPLLDQLSQVLKTSLVVSPNAQTLKSVNENGAILNGDSEIYDKSAMTRVNQDREVPISWY